MNVNKTPFRDEAMPLIQYEPETQKYIINNEAIELIQSLPAPIGVVGVAGMYRTGKSYLLNRMLLNRSDGFGVGPTVNPCTKGLWVWGRPLKGQTCDGDPCSILVIDSEGLGALDEDSTHDSRIFSLTILLSSCFIYNSVGSIDENAIQNLSLIVNLTKNIQIKSQAQPGTDQTYDDFSQYFPQFYWVVRDFTLQLVDQDGEAITSRDYLEKALQIQKGFSDHIEQKNRIRRLLQAFFKERDCITLVRPLTKEENLQNLEKLEFDKLRPEFFQQVMDLRKKILNRVKPKQINGRNLSGQMYCDLVRSHLAAINQGAVPAIESAWNYICRNECQKSLGEAMETFEQKLKELLNNKLPLPPDELQSLVKSAKEMAIVSFHKRSVGEVRDEYLKELTRRIRARFSVIKQENEREAMRTCLKFITKEFDPVEQKLKKGEYRSFQDIEQEIRLFYNYYMENGPKEAVNRQAIVLDKMNRSLIEGGHLIVKLMTHESEVQKAIVGDTLKKLEQDLKESKADVLKERNTYSLQLKTFEKERSDIMTREQILLQSIEDLKQQKSATEAELRSEFAKEKNDLQRQLTEMKERVHTMEDGFKELERTALFGNSEAEKDRALSNQKLTFLERALEEASRKERDLIAENKSQKAALLTQQKEVASKTDQQIYQLTQQLSDLKEKLAETETQLSDRDSRFDVEQRRFESKEKQLQKQNLELQECIQSLQREVRELRRNEELWGEQRQLDADVNSQQLVERLDQALEQLRVKEDQLKLTRHQNDKERAIMQQKLEFMEVQLGESKNQLDENRKAHDAIMKVFESSQLDNSHKTDNVKLNDLRDQHKRDLKGLESDHQIQCKKLQQQIDQLSERNNELEMKVKFETGDLLMEIDSLKQQLFETETVRAKLAEQNKILESQKHGIFRDQEQRYKAQIVALECAIEAEKNRAAQELQSVQARAEEELGQLKNFYELERERLESRISEEKEKNQKRYQMTQEEFYQRQKEQELQYEEDVESLREELREQEATYQNMIQQYEHDKQIKQQSIDNLESKIKDLKESNLSIQNNHNTALEQQMNLFTCERKEMIAKNELQATTISKLQKELMALEQRRDYLENEKVRKEVQLETSRKTWNEERKELFEKLDEAKNKLQNLNDEYLEKKIEYGRELALVQQQNEFSQKKIDDLQKQIEVQCTRFEEKIKVQKQEIQGEMNSKLERALEDRSVLEQKYEKIKKSLKDIETTANRQTSTLEREKAILGEKLTIAEGKVQELEQKIKEETSQSSSVSQGLREQLAQEKKQLTGELDRLRQAYNLLEQEKSETNATYEREKALWEGKFHFLEQQKEQAKQDLVDALKKFEMTLMHLQRARNNEKDEQESNLSDIISNVERNYQKQIDDLNQTHSRNVQDYEEKLRRLHKELKQQKDQVLIDQHGKIGNQLLSEKKFAEMLDNEKKLHQEIENLKCERDQKVFEYSKQFDVERDSLRAKNQELEARYKEIEIKRSSLIFEFEKERAKWNLDKDHLMNIKNELSDQMEKLERKKEFLLRENEKLKNEQRATRRSVNTVHNMTSHTLLTGNKYKPGGINNVSSKDSIQSSAIGLSTRHQQLSPSHSSNTSTSSSHIGPNKHQYQLDQQQSNLADITNFSQQPDGRMKQPLQPLYVLGDDIPSKYQSYYDAKEDVSPMKMDSTGHHDRIYPPKY